MKKSNRKCYLWMRCLFQMCRSMDCPSLFKEGCLALIITWLKNQIFRAAKPCLFQAVQLTYILRLYRINTVFHFKFLKREMTMSKMKRLCFYTSHVFAASRSLGSWSRPLIKVWHCLRWRMFKRLTHFSLSQRQKEVYIERVINTWVESVIIILMVLIKNSKR